MIRSSILRDGTSQEQRFLPALGDGYISVDEMSLESLLAMSGEYAGLLKYFDANNRESGDWKAFFEADEAYILASILATSLKQAEADFFRFAQELEDSPGMLRDGDKFMSSFPGTGLAKRINGWLVGLGSLSSVAAMRAREKISVLIDKSLGNELRSLYACMREENEAAADSVFSGFEKDWELGSGREGVRCIWGEPHMMGPFLRNSFYAFHNAVRFLQEEAGELMRLSLGRNNHDPAMGLFISFLHLFSRVQQKINRFTRQHQDFYYGDVLKVRCRKGVPDSTYLLFTPSVPGREVQIAKGTEFLAGADEKNVDLIYAADDDLRVTDAMVCALHTIFIERNETVSPESLPRGGQDDLHRFATGMKLNRIGGAKEEGGPATGGKAAHPLFGDTRRHKKVRLFEDARLGLAVASNILLMKEGARDVSVTFRLVSPEYEGDVLEELLVGLESISSSREDAFFKVFRHMFRISLTAESGWMEVEEYLPLCRAVEPSCETNCLKIQFRIPDSAGAIIPYSQKIHGEALETGLPVLRITINPGAYLYPYTLLSELVAREILLEVGVTGARGILVYNQTGQLSIDAQFAPFGPTPMQEDYLVVGCHEAAGKKLLDFGIEVEWGGLPPGVKDFAGYYHGYSGVTGNDTFRARLSVLRDRKWIPAAAEERPETVMFESAEGGMEAGGICRKRRFSFHGLCRFMRPLDDVAEGQYAYDPASKDGFFRIALSNPPGAFGHREYPLILSQVLTENAGLRRFGLTKFLSKSLPPKPLPNSPYTPMVSSISVDYRAVSSISLEQVASSEMSLLREKAFHLHPLGSVLLSPDVHGRASLVPRYDADGNLLIGISGGKLSGILTLFFHLRGDSQPEAGGELFRFTWHYLASNQWKKLDQSRVISDDTRGFLSSGIVTLDIPSDITCNNTVLPEGVFWLKVTADGGSLYSLCSLYGVYAQALKATCTRQDGNAHAYLATGLPAGTIKEARLSLPGIAAIRQIMDSSGGMLPEEDRQRTIRTSERLKHKNRGIAPWDYERLVLQRFPEIFKVKCFPCMSGDEGAAGRVEPGHLLLVILPYLKEGAAANSRPMGNALLLREVREFVAGLSSGFIEVHVRNPDYEQMQVRCKVKFKKGLEPGISLNRLNQEIFDYLFPWSAGGMDGKFDWVIRCNEVQSHIRKLEYVEAVSGLSLLRVGRAGRHKYSLSDTARQHMGEIRPSYPWSIAVPLRRHLLEVVTEGRNFKPEKTGISRLAIGSTFILSRGSA